MENTRKMAANSCLTRVFGTGGGKCFRFRLQGISHSNKPVIRLKAIRKRKNSLRSDNFLFLVNAVSQALTMTNTPSQSPSTFPPRLSRKVRQKGCICLIFCIQPIGGPLNQARNFRFRSGFFRHIRVSVEEGYRSGRKAY